MIIALDGPAASGKGTLARRLAAALNLAHLDTGMVYRATAAKALASLETAESETADAAPDEALLLACALDLTAADLDRPDLRSEKVGEMASLAAASAPVRAALLDFQRRFATRPPAGKAGAILDGRDIGTVVCPDALVKLYVTASPEVRAHRRHKELIERGEESIYARVLRDLEQRDRRDSSRSVAPLKPADDAVMLDTSDMDAETAFERALEIVRLRTGLDGAERA